MLYRFFDEADLLLYVGITIDPQIRWHQHSRDKDWWTKVARVTVEHYPSRVEALAAEKRAIQAEHPVYNIVHNHARRMELDIHLGRPMWIPKTCEQAALLNKAQILCEVLRETEEAVWQIILEGRKVGIPDMTLCAATNQSRATLNRKFGPRPEGQSH